MIVVAMMLAACRHSSVETRLTPSNLHFIASPETVAHPTLQAIDSLMWQRPDSALAVLMDFAASPKADSLDEFDGHYTQLLASELLYKNYYKQSNRPDLLLAVSYFDSLTLTLNDSRHTPHRHRGLDPQSLTQDDIVFLDARAHYINGVGYYERDSVVEACKEYIKALEIMEGYFKEQEFLGKKARFMAYTYNRLGELFSEQFMMESAISCYENAFFYCHIEPTSPNGIANILYQIGKQYDKLDEIDLARQYYAQALENITDTDNSLYRDIVSSKALCDYLSGSGMEQPLKALRDIAGKMETEDELLNRSLTIGGIFFFEKVYDSALYYFGFVFNNERDIGLQKQSANYLCAIYDSIGETEQSNVLRRFLTSQKKSDGENKALASHLSSLFQTYLDNKQARQTEIERAREVRKALFVVIPIIVVLMLAIPLAVRGKGKRLKKKHLEDLSQQEQTLEKERNTHDKEKKALQQDLKQRDEQLDSLKKALEQRHVSLENEREKFLNEPICRSIVNKVGDLQLSTRSRYSDYPRAWLAKEDAMLLGDAVEKHFPEFKTRLKAKYPKIDWKGMQICYLCLLGLEEAQIAVLLQQNPATIYRRISNMKETLGNNAALADFLWELAVI